MIRSFVALVVNLALVALILCQTTPEGEMLLLEYHGLLYAVGVLLLCAIINAIFIIIPDSAAGVD